MRSAPWSPQFPLDHDPLTALAGWAPNEKDTAADADHYVQLWRKWWLTTQAPPAPKQSSIVSNLATTGRSELPGLLFEFNSAVIRPESEPVLKEVADALAANPGWKVSVEGHTDNVGGARYNLSLSEKRAAAVREALVRRYHVSEERLAAKGFGAQHPKVTNDTKEGREQNRRVELVRLPS